MEKFINVKFKHFRATVSIKVFISLFIYIVQKYVGIFFKKINLYLKMVFDYFLK